MYIEVINLKKNYLTIILCIVIVILLIIVGYFILNKSFHTNNANLNEQELVTYLQNKGYKFSAYKDTLTNITTYYIYVKNNNIAFQRIDNPYLGTTYSWSNNNINDEWANILEPDKNTKENEKQQYSAYLKWLNNVNLDKSQIITVLDYYYKNNNGFASFEY